MADAASSARAAPHVLLVTVGSAGDMYPFLHLALALIGRGHRATLVGPQAHVALAQAAGVPFIGLGTHDDYLAVLKDPDLWHPRRGFAVLWRALRDGLSLLEDALSALPPDEPLALIAHPLALPGAAIARVRRPGLRVVAAWLAPTNLRSLHDPLLIGPLRIARWVPLAWRQRVWRTLDALVIDPVAVPDLNAARARHGLGPIEHFIDHMESVADAHLTLFPAWFAPTPPDWPTPLTEGSFPLYDPHGQPAPHPDLERFLAAGTAPIVFTPGSGNRQAAAWFERALRAAQRLGARAILLTPDRTQVPATLPPGALWLPYVPLRALLPRVAALVHHGGIGTTSEALRAGVPQLIIPQAYDQFDNGARVEALEAGRMLAGWRARPRRLAATLARMLATPAQWSGCALAAQRIANDAERAAGLGAELERLLNLPSPGTTRASREGIPH